MPDSHDLQKTNRLVVYALAVVLLGYVAALTAGLPQRATALVVNAQHDEVASEAEPGESRPVEEAATHTEDGAADHATAGRPPPYWTVTPFVVLLLAVALFPVLPWTEHWWDSDLHRFQFSAFLAVLTLLYFLVWHDTAIEGHWPAHHVSSPQAGLNWSMTFDVFANAIFTEYVPFIALLFSLYTISSGIRIAGDLRPVPLTNTGIIGLGALLASFVGTTGAAILLIWLLLDTNARRKHVQHTVIFFIFTTCNCGGLLLPIGDPPLFLGYLKGVPFLWTFSLWEEWLLVNGSLLAIYFLLDTFWYYPRETHSELESTGPGHRLRVWGLWPHLPLLVGVVAAVALLDPSQAFPGTNWHPPMYLREAVQLTMVALSLLFGDPQTRIANRFNYHAIIEVAALFFGIFITMQPALQILAVRGPDFGLTTPGEFFWVTGTMSAFLDNAPTYVVFFETARSLGGENLVSAGSGVAEHLLVGISLGAVFMGASTYIGNAPNFMVRAIADTRGVNMPSFFGYMLWSGLFLLPLMVVVTFLFL